ncbi:MAG: stalk domain-containing protein [Peptococcaceae bacterium]
MWTVKHIKKGISCIMAVLLALGLVAGMGLTSWPAQAAGSTGFAAGQYLYFGRYTGEPLMWRVMEIDEANRTATLLLVDVLKDYSEGPAEMITNIYDDSVATDWQSSVVCDWLNGNDFLNGSYLGEQYFSEAEKEAILPYSSDSGFGQRIILPSFTELGGQNNVVPANGEGTRWQDMPLTDAATAAPGRTVPGNRQYHTRSIYHASGTYESAWMVDNDGGLYYSGIGNDYALRPACKINLRAVFCKSGRGSSAAPYELGFVGQYVEFGSYQGDPVLWWIMAGDNDEQSITLLAEAAIEDNPPFYNQPLNTSWMLSDICGWLNSAADGFLNGSDSDTEIPNFTTAEKNVILPYDSGAPAYNQKIVLPSFTELGGTGGIVPGYGEGAKWIYMPVTGVSENNVVRVAVNNKAYWTRSILHNSGYSNSAWLVSMYGALNGRAVNTAGMGVRPVCKIDLHSVGFPTGSGLQESPYGLEAETDPLDISGDFTDPNFKQAVWEWLGNTGQPGSFTQQDLVDQMEANSYTLDVQFKSIAGLAGLQHFAGTGLEILNCNDNQVSSLPVLPASLTRLECYRNQLSSLPELPDGLQWLNCGVNQVSSLPQLPDNLEFLGCWNNQLSSLPDLPDTLEFLWCQDNQLSSLPGLPANLGSLNCGANQLNALPDLPLTLTNLRCEGNQLAIIPELPPGLELLNCAGNRLDSLPTLPAGLEYLYCGTNQLRSLPALPENLKYLYCHDNQLSTLPGLPAGIVDLRCRNNYLNVFAGPLQGMINSCSAAIKISTPQYRYAYTGAAIRLLPSENRQLSASELEKQQSADGNAWSKVEDSVLSQFSFSSSDGDVAVVDSNGLITTQSNGECVIYARYKNLDAEFTMASIPVMVSSEASNKVSAAAADNSVTMAAGNTTLSADDSWLISIGNATVAESVYAGDLRIGNLPDGLMISAEKSTGNTVAAAVYGTAGFPVEFQVPVSMIIKASAVTNPAAEDSDPVTVYINPFNIDEDITPPAVPDNLRMTNRTSSGVTIAWDASNDASGIEQYYIQRKTGHGDYADLGTARDNRYQDTGLNRSTSYTYRVRAEDKSRNRNLSDWSSPLAVTTGPGSSGGGGGSSGPVIRRQTPPEGTVGISYSHTFTVSGGKKDYTFAVTSGTLPEGLNLAAGGVLSGTPREAGTYKYTITVTDGKGRTSRYAFVQVIQAGGGVPVPEQEINLTIGSRAASVNGRPYILNAEPFLVAEVNRTLVPIRFIGEALGAEVVWNPVTRQVIIKDIEQEIILTIGSDNVFINTQTVIIDCVPVVLPPGCTFVPLRFVSENLGAQVDYDSETGQIRISR